MRPQLKLDVAPLASAQRVNLLGEIGLAGAGGSKEQYGTRLARGVVDGLLERLTRLRPPPDLAAGEFWRHHFQELKPVLGVGELEDMTGDDGNWPSALDLPPFAGRV